MNIHNVIFTGNACVPLNKLNTVNLIGNLKFNETSNELILIENPNAVDTAIQNHRHHQTINRNNMNSNLVQNVTILSDIPIVNTANGKVQIYIDDKNLFLQLEKICRCCLTECSNMQNIFDDENCIADMIMAIAPIQILPSDGLSAQICMQCVLHVSRALSFKQQLETADRSLRHFINEGYLTGMKLQSLYSDNLDSAPEEIISNEPIEIIEEEDAMTTTESIHVEDNIQQSAPTMLTQNLIYNIEPLEECKLESGYTTETIIHELCEPNDSGNIQQESNEPFHVSEVIEDVSIDDNERSNGASATNNTDIELPNNDETVPSQIKCTTCEKIFGDIRRLKRHDKVHLIKKPFECDKCGKGFNERADLTKHSARHPAIETPAKSNEFLFKCPDCFTGFNFERDLNIHASIHTQDGIFSCVECKKVFSTLVQLKRHVRIHFTEKPFKCHICGMCFAEMGSRTRHYRRHTGEQREKKYLCTTCGKKYYDSHSLSVHIRTHTGEKPWSCKECGKTFIDCRLLNSHMKIHQNEKPHVCNTCNRKFTHQSTLTTHLRTHTGEKPYFCKLCDKSFIQSSNLALHMRTHSGEKPYKCSLATCSRTFASSSSLKIHKRIHTGEKPYSCPVEGCNKQFARHDISIHMRTHTGEKPYECTVKACTKRFTTSGQLTQHLRSHYNIRPYICAICNQACSSSTYLRKHMSMHATRGLPLPLQLNNSNATIMESIATAATATVTTAATTHSVKNESDVHMYTELIVNDNGDAIGVETTDAIETTNQQTGSEQFIFFAIPSQADENVLQQPIMFQY